MFFSTYQTILIIGFSASSKGSIPLLDAITPKNLGHFAARLCLVNVKGSIPFAFTSAKKHLAIDGSLGAFSASGKGSIPLPDAIAHPIKNRKKSASS